MGSAPPPLHTGPNGVKGRGASPPPMEADGSECVSIAAHCEPMAGQSRMRMGWEAGRAADFLDGTSRGCAGFALTDFAET